MHSRAILLLCLFLFACLLGLGAVALQLTVADAATQAPRTDAAGAVTPAPDATSVGTSAQPPPDAMDPRYAPLADSARAMLVQAHVRFAPYSADVNNAMIPHLADIITLANQQDDLFYRFELTDPDAGLALRRAEALQEVLHLNLLNPDQVQLLGRQGPPGVVVHVTAAVPSASP